MLVKKIHFISPIEEITNIEDDNIDVFVELEDGYTYNLVIATPKNLISLMEKERIQFSEPGHPFVVVKKLTKEIVEQAVKAYAENDAYWLKLYHFAGDLNTTIFDKLQTEHVEYLNELDKLEDS